MTEKYAALPAVFEVAMYPSKLLLPAKIEKPPPRFAPKPIPQLKQAYPPYPIVTEVIKFLLKYTLPFR